MPLWLIPMIYTVVSMIAGIVLPRLEYEYFPFLTQDMSVGSALASFSAVASGTMALTGIVFAIAFVMVQFSALAYSPRLVIMFASSPALYHTLGVFFSTFAYSLVALIWTDRHGAGTVPFLSSWLVAILLVISMLAFARLIQTLNALQIHNVLRNIGARGRGVIGTLFPRIADAALADQAELDGLSRLGEPTQTLTYSGEPRAIARFDIQTLVRLAQRADAVFVLECAVGDTVVEDSVLMRVYGPLRLPDAALRRAVHLATSRTFEQDPKYAIRLLVDIAIRALSPAINDRTTAVQALDQIEDLLRRLGRRQVDAGYARDQAGTLRVTFPVPTWEDYLHLSFDEIRQYGASSVQVVRRLRAALAGVVDSISVPERRAAVLGYLDHLNLGVGRSAFDDLDQAAALQEDRQGLGLSRRHRDSGDASVAKRDLRIMSTSGI
jgi:uncharacterized membrane protein